MSTMAITEDEFFKLVGDKTVEGAEKLLKKFYGEEWGKAIGNERQTSDVTSGLADMFWAHIEAPLKAFNGDGVGAVDSAVGAVGSIAGGVIGGPPGALIGKVISTAPGWIIDYYDTTNPQFSVVISNLSKYHIRFTSNSTNYRALWTGYVANIPGGKSAYYDTKKIFIPKAVTFQKNEAKVEQVIFSCPITVHSKWAYISYQLEAVNENGKVMKTYDIGFKYPGGWFGESHYVGVFEDSGWPRRERENYECLEAVGHQDGEGKHNRPEQGTSGKSMGWWETWRHCQFELY